MGAVVGFEVERLLDDAESLSPQELADRLQEAERVARRVAAVKAGLVSIADRTSAFVEDGHRRVSSWIHATIRVSRREALDLARLADVCREHPVVRAHLAAGTLGTRQANDLARLQANPRLREPFGEVVDAFVTVAEHASYDVFVDKVQQWAQLTDADGTLRDADACHERRHAHLSTIGHSTFLDVCVSAAQGEAIAEVLSRFEDAEFAADWDACVARHGDEATPDLLASSPAQRRADAIVAIFHRAAAQDPNAVTPGALVNIVISQPVYEETLTAIIEGRTPCYEAIPQDQLFCSTTSGTSIDPATAVAASLVGHVRRIVVDTAGRVIDVGRQRRTFTNAARDGALVQAALDGTYGRCLWPGCGRRRTELDHRDEWHRDHGCSDLHNADWLCNLHNILKTTGYRTWRDPDGTWHLIRPDGTEIDAA